MAQSSNNNAIINTSSLINHGNSIAHTSSQPFWDRSVSAIEKGLRDDCSGNVDHPTPGCTDMENCTQCLLLSSLSAVSAAFTADAGSLNTGSHGGLWNESAADTLSPHTTSVLSQSHSDDKNIPGCLKVNSKTSTSSVPQDITDLLMKCLISHNKFISYLAKKALLSGIQYQHIKVSDVIRLIKAEKASSRDHLSLPVALIELLKDLMSKRLFQNGNTTETVFEFLKDFDYLYLLEIKIDANIDGCQFSDTNGLDVHLSLVHKVVKHVMCRLEKCNQENLNFICTVIQHSVIPHTEAVFSISSNNGGYLICLKHLKSISALLDLRFLEDKDALPSCTVQVCEKLLEKMPKILLQAEAGGLLRPRNFIGTTPVSQQQHGHNNRAISVLIQIITVTLKACAFMAKRDKSYHIAVASSLETFWVRIRQMISGADDTPSQDWLPLVFGDQDDQWIAALFCLLVIYRELEYGPNGRDRSQHGGNHHSCNNKENVEVHKLLQTICPHKLFLQLTKFIDHDHLVFTDFLVSPETSFLTYFTQYLHLVCNNWASFSSACLALSTEDNFQKADTNSTEINISSMTTEKRCMSVCNTVRDNTSQNSEAIPDFLKTEIKPCTNDRADVRNTSTVFADNNMTSSTLVSTQLFSEGQTYSNHADRSDSGSWNKVDLPSSSLVSYSDSESDNSLDEQEKVTCKGRKNRKRFLSSNSDVDECISVKHFHQNSSDSSGECKHENTNTVFGQGFGNHHNTENRLELTMDMLIRLRLHIERLAESDLFPYNAKPLLHLLEACEAIYENAEQEII